MVLRDSLSEFIIRAAGSSRIRMMPEDSVVPPSVPEADGDAGAWRLSACERH